MKAKLKWTLVLTLSIVITGIIAYAKEKPAFSQVDAYYLTAGGICSQVTFSSAAINIKSLGHQQAGIVDYTGTPVLLYTNNTCTIAAEFHN